MPRRLIESSFAIPEGRLQEWAGLISEKFAGAVDNINPHRKE